MIDIISQWGLINVCFIVLVWLIVILIFPGGLIFLSGRAIPWIPTWQGLDGYQRSLRPCALDKSSLSIGRFNPLMLITAKTAWQFWWNIAGKNKFRKIFDGDMFMRILLTTLLQIFCKIILNSKTVVISIGVPDDNFWRNPEPLMR